MLTNALQTLEDPEKMFNGQKSDTLSHVVTCNNFQRLDILQSHYLQDCNQIPFRLSSIMLLNI